MYGNRQIVVTISIDEWKAEKKHPFSWFIHIETVHFKWINKVKFFSWDANFNIWDAFAKFRMQFAEVLSRIRLWFVSVLKIRTSFNCIGSGDFRCNVFYASPVHYYISDFFLSPAHFLTKFQFCDWAEISDLSIRYTYIDES